MTEYYTHLWFKQYGEIGGDTFMSWAIELKDKTPEQILRATEYVLNVPADYPPNLATFKRAIIDSLPPYADHQNALPPPPPPDKDDPTWIAAYEKWASRARELGYLKTTGDNHETEILD